MYMFNIVIMNIMFIITTRISLLFHTYVNSNIKPTKKMFLSVCCDVSALKMHVGTWLSTYFVPIIILIKEG